MRRKQKRRKGLVIGFSMARDDCLFCRISTKSSERVVYSNDSFLVIKDLAPVSKGHSLVIIKEHVVSLFDLDPTQMQNLLDALKQTKLFLDKEFSPDAYNVGVNDGRAAGRTKDHLHVHVIPRYVGDVDDPIGGVRNLKGKFVEPAN